MSRILTGATSRNLLKLAVVLGYATLMIASLVGVPSSQAQSPPSGAATAVLSNLTVSPARLDFGFRAVLPPDGQVSDKPKIVTLSVAKNQPQSVTIESLMVSDSTLPPAQFTIQSNTCTVIAPGASCQVPMIFQPNGAARRRALLLVTSNASNGVQSVQLVGHAKQGTLSINPTSLTFGTVKMGDPPTASKSVTLTNKNPINLTIQNVTSSNSSVFPVTSTCPSPGVLQPNAKCTVSVSLSPDRNGSLGGQITIADNATGRKTIKLSGTGRGFPTVTRTATRNQDADRDADCDARCISDAGLPGRPLAVSYQEFGGGVRAISSRIPMTISP